MNESLFEQLIVLFNIGIFPQHCYFLTLNQEHELLKAKPVSTTPRVVTSFPG